MPSSWPTAPPSATCTCSSASSPSLALVTFQSGDHQEAPVALREKRLPVFKDC
jgi:hypothetical protein